MNQITTLNIDHRPQRNLLDIANFCYWPTNPLAFATQAATDRQVDANNRPLFLGQLPYELAPKHVEWMIDSLREEPWMPEEARKVPKGEFVLKRGLRNVTVLDPKALLMFHGRILFDIGGFWYPRSLEDLQLPTWQNTFHARGKDSGRTLMLYSLEREKRVFLPNQPLVIEWAKRDDPQPTYRQLGQRPVLRRPPHAPVPVDPTYYADFTLWTMPNNPYHRGF